jgi:murein DD-endopeptidase MepM/ murein hydrolase activator NlpD
MRRTTICILIVILFTLTLPACNAVRGVNGPPADTAAAAPPAPPPDAYTPILISIEGAPIAFKMTDARYHMVYEVRLTNATSTDQPIDRFQIKDQDRKESLLDLDPPGITQISAPGTCTLSAGYLPPHDQCLLLIHISVDTLESIPKALAHTLYRPPLPDGALQPEPTITANVILNNVVLGPPLADGRWLAYNGCCTGSHRREIQSINNAWNLPERFAIDFYLMVAEVNRLAPEAGAPLLAYESFDRKALAVGDGTVVQISEKVIPDNPPGIPAAPGPSPRPWDRYGNYVVIRLNTPPDTYVLYGNLEFRKVLVRVGEPVHRGQVIGLVGNSGDSKYPHLHFEVINRKTDSLMGAQGIPFVFSSFELYGQAKHSDDSQAPAPTLEAIDRSPHLLINAIRADSDSIQRANEMPANLDFINFDPWDAPYK